MSISIANLPPVDSFAGRHNGPRASDIDAMLGALGYDSLDALMDALVPSDIRRADALEMPAGISEAAALARLRELADQNTVAKSYIGMGYYDCITPPVILRNILENPGWYTAYTPYQPEIAQGRLEALLNFQTVVSDLTGLAIANASLLDEATAVAEAVTMTNAVSKKKTEPQFLLDRNCHPQTIAVVETRARVQGVKITVTEVTPALIDEAVTGVIVQYPTTEGALPDYRAVTNRAHEAGALVTAATDLLSLTLLTPPGEWGADIAVGSAQRLGVPMGYGGPHAAFFATREEYKRHVPGRIIGVSKDVEGHAALRMALQTREQHIRREKATSNICTAQVLLAVISGMYAVYHGPDGLRRIANRIHQLAALLAAGLEQLGLTIVHPEFFDTIVVEGEPDRMQAVRTAAEQRRLNFRTLSDTRVGIALDETTLPADVGDILTVFAGSAPVPDMQTITLDDDAGLPPAHRRTTSYLDHPVFHRYRSETEMLRYLKRLEDRDLSLTSAMIPLGSCTMKLNATTEMIPVTWPEFGGIHPFAPRDQTLGYTAMFEELERQLAEITGFHAVSLQPNAGSQGEFAGLLVIRAYHDQRGDHGRTTCLIPRSAHGTNPASAVMAGMNVVVVATDERGNIDVADLKDKAASHADTLGALMVTYPSTHGVFEATIREVCEVIHRHGGQVYMDGANMNAQVGLSRPGDFGADVCHLNLHKTFCIPHGGGGPGMGPIGVGEHLAPFLPDHPVVPLHIPSSCGAVSAAPWGSPSIMTISWAYLQMMGGNGLTEATRVSILNANYIARRLEGHYDLLYAGENGLIAHECIIDTRPFKASAGVSVEDMAKRLIDYGFHPPTISFPVPGTMMIEPTESESREELDRFCDAMIAIRNEIREIETGEVEPGNNLLSNAPHPLQRIIADSWDKPYSRERAAYPSPETREHKVWPFVGRIDAAFGDRNLVCVCPPIEAFEVASTA